MDIVAVVDLKKKKYTFLFHKIGFALRQTGQISVFFFLLTWNPLDFDTPTTDLKCNYRTFLKRHI